jgi:hypothetical protein
MAAAVAAGDIVPSGTVSNPMIMPEELAIAMNKFSRATTLPPLQPA